MRSPSGTTVAIALLAACTGTPPPPALPHAAREVVELQRWQIVQDGAPVGVVRQLEIRDPKGPVPYYRVEDLSGRWLGHATANGRFSRRVPFQSEEQDLGVWSLEQGVAKLLEAAVPLELRAMPVEADARRSR
jgi:hypothetical protein